MKRPSFFVKRGESGERGATLFLILLVLFILMGVGALGLDLSMKANRGQELQNAADAAALVGANRWNATLNQGKVQTAVNEVLTLNGIDPGVTVTVGYAGSSEVTVTLTDPSYGGLFNGFFNGGGGVERESTGRQNVCVVGCNQVIEAPPIIHPIRAFGTGDGFLPIQVGSKFYSINHHEDTVDCVDQDTGLQCFTEKPSFPLTISPGSYPPYDSSQTKVITSDMHHPALIGTKIYYTGHPSAVAWVNDFDPAAGPTYLTCFDTATDTLCPSVLDVGVVGHAVMAVVDDDIYLFATNRQVFCFQTPSLSPCSGYPATGRDGQLSSQTWNFALSSTFSSDQRVIGNKIFSTISNHGEVWIQCWDTTATGQPCSTFTAKQLPGTGFGSKWTFGSNTRMLIARDTAGAPTALCVNARSRVTCYDPDTGARDSAAELDLDKLRALMVNTSWTGGWSGTHSYHPPTNRLFAVDAEDSYTFCYDFTEEDVCDENGASIYTTVDGTETQTYGYIYDEMCLIGLGDASIFHTMKTDLSGPCDSSAGTVEITSCSCADGEVVWPEVEAIETEGVTDFRVRVTNPAGDALLPDPNDDDVWHDLLTGPFDLSSIGTHTHLVLHFDVVVDPNQNPWDLGVPPTFIVNGDTIPPHLVG